MEQTPTRRRRAAGAPRRSQTLRAGLQFSMPLDRRLVRSDTLSDVTPIGATAAVYCAASPEYLAAEVLELIRR